jgi:hypothetical protein
MKPVMMVRPPLGILNDQGFWDEMKDAGIREVAIQWLTVYDKRGDPSSPPMLKPEDIAPRTLAAAGGKDAKGIPVGAFKPNAALFKGMKLWSPPEMPPSVADQVSALHTALDRAKKNGFKLWVMDDKGYHRQGGTGTGRPAPAAISVCDPETPKYTGARIKDVIDNFPHFEAVVLDGPDFKWDIKPGSRDDLFIENFDDPHHRQFAASIGMSIDRVIQGRDNLKKRLSSLTPAYVDDFVKNCSAGASAYLWWTEDPTIAHWVAYKQAVVDNVVSSTVREIRSRCPGLKIGTSSRVPAMTIINGHNLRRERAYTDFQLPKEYWWFAVAGIRDTVNHWVLTLADWNKGLSEEQAARWFSAAFDYAMPLSGYLPSQYGKPATKEWFETTVRDQTRQMIAAVGGVDRFVPFVGCEHFNVGWMAPEDLHGVLAEMHAQGAKRYCYYTYNSLRPEYWKSISEFSRG